MAAAGSAAGPVILFTREGISYEHRESLGVGPHGESLLLARKRTSNTILEDVIVKCLGLPQGSPSAQLLRARARLQEEARLGEYLRHRALVRVLFLHETADALYTVSERVQGPTLDELLMLALERQKFFSEAFLLHVGAELASALHHVHTRADEHGHALGIVHRNLSLSSIVFAWRQGLKLADFSLAWSQLQGRRATTARQPRSPLFFSAPEVLLEGKVDARSDLFALGLVLLELATGRHLYDPAHKTPDELEESLSKQERKHVERLLRGARREGMDATEAQALWGAAAFTEADVERTAAAWAAPWKALLGRLLRRAPEERFQTAAEVEEAFRARLELVGPYDRAEAEAEVEQALADAGQALVAQEVTTGWLSPASSRGATRGEATTR